MNMPNNNSRLLAEKYFSSKQQRIRIEMKDWTQMDGYIVSYCLEDLDAVESDIYAWHVVFDEASLPFGMNEKGKALGVFILHKNIRAVYFYKDNSTMIMY